MISNNLSQNEASYIYYSAHSDEIIYLCKAKYVFGPLFLSCSKDKTIKIWKMHQIDKKVWFELVNTYLDSNGIPKQGIFVDEDTIASITIDGVLNVWNFYTLQKNSEFATSKYLLNNKYSILEYYYYTHSLIVFCEIGHKTIPLVYIFIINENNKYK